jgi:EAL domain-containing protein (putative c-di-GMP-specific phosphodiesterase class I)
VLEITEHAAIRCYPDVLTAMQPLRDKGLRIAVDDAGAGYSSFRHILTLSPDIIKLDMSIVRNIDSDRSRKALAAALMGFARATGSKVVAEGVETLSELSVLRELGVDKAQGHLLAKPTPLDVAAALPMSMH